MNRDEIATLRSIDHAVGIFSELVDKSEGRVLNFTGDGAFASFESVAGALACALGFQDRVTAAAIPIRFRIGVHLGEVFEESGRIYGDSINVAERLQSIAPVGGVAISDLVYRAVRGRSEFCFEYIGPKTVKNIPDPIEVYRVRGGTGPLPAKMLKAPDRQSVFDASDRPSVAFLPFRDLSADSDQGFFGEGIADDIITNLSRFRHLDVIARGSSFAFRGLDLPSTEIGRRLGARYVAEGSIRRIGPRVRVTMDLVDTPTSRIIWAERYDRPLEDIFAIQDEIAALSVGAMSVTIEDAEKQRARAAPPDSLPAYGLVLKGASHILNYTAQDNLLARSCFCRALKESPQYGRALASLSRTHSLDWRYSWAKDRDQSQERAFEFAVQAIEVDPNDARGWAELGFAQLYRREHDRSLASYRRALSLNPNDANIIAETADALAHSGEAEEALQLFARAMRLNPFYPDQYLWDMAGAYCKLRRFEEAIDCIQRMNNPAQGRRILACCYAHLGMIEDARRIADLIRTAQPGFDAEHWATNIVPDRRPEDVQLFISGLRAAGL